MAAVEPGRWDTKLDRDSAPAVCEMLERSKEFRPRLRHARLDEADLRQGGLRPFGTAGV